MTLALSSGAVIELKEALSAAQRRHAISLAIVERHRALRRVADNRQALSVT
jgi:hypothetical protein